MLDPSNGHILLEPSIDPASIFYLLDPSQYPDVVFGLSNTPTILLK